MTEYARLHLTSGILLLLVMCVGSAPARSADCAQLNKLMSITDLKTLTTGPLVPKPKEKSKIGPAKVVLEGVGVHCVVRITDKQGYECMRSFNEINHDINDAKLVQAVKHSLLLGVRAL